MDSVGSTYNKDSDGLFCPKGEHSTKTCYVRTKKNIKDRASDVVTYHFDIEKYKVCSMRERCYKTGSKTKSRSRSIMANIYKNQENFQNSEVFKLIYKDRSKVEVKM